MNYYAELRPSFIQYLILLERGFFGFMNNSIYYYFIKQLKRCTPDFLKTLSFKITERIKHVAKVLQY